MVQAGAKMVERGAEMGKGRGALAQSQPDIAGRSESLEEGPRGTERSKGLWRGDYRRFPQKTVAGMKNLLQALAIPGSEDLPVLDNPEVMKQIPGAVSLSEGSSTTLIVGKADPSVSPVDFVAAPDRVIAVVASKRSRSNNPVVGVGARSPPQAAPNPA
ncbi:unnamed protein product [Calypogeia fissa]